MLAAVIKKNDQKAKWLIGIFSVVVLVAVTFLSKFTLVVDLPFDKHIFALVNALLNATVAFLLVVALIAVKQKNYNAHKNIMLTALLLSVLFLVSYIAHHLFAGETKFGGEGTMKAIYYLILFTHIPLAGIILPFILFTAYRALVGEYEQHKKLTRITWPIWFYVAVTGVIVYWMISPYYV